MKSAIVLCLLLFFSVACCIAGSVNDNEHNDLFSQTAFSKSPVRFRRLTNRHNDATSAVGDQPSSPLGAFRRRLLTFARTATSILSAVPQALASGADAVDDRPEEPQLRRGYTATSHPDESGTQAQEGAILDFLMSIPGRFGEAVVSSAKAIRATSNPDSVSAGADTAALMKRSARSSASTMAPKRDGPAPKNVGSTLKQQGFFNHPKYPMRPDGMSSPRTEHRDYVADFLATGRVAVQRKAIEKATPRRRAMRAQQAQPVLSRTNPDGTPYIPEFCRRGAIAAPVMDGNTSITFSCNITGNTENMTSITLEEYMALNQSARHALCTPDTPIRQCVCPRDYELASSLFGDLDCITKRVGCNQTILEPVRSCPPRTVLDSENEPVCFVTSRTAPVRVRLQVNCDYVWVSEAEREAAGVSIENTPPTDEEFVVVGVGESADVIQNVSLNASNAHLFIGNYANISANAFEYWDADPASGRYFSASHGVVTDLAAFIQIYSFRNPSDTSLLIRFPFNDADTFTPGLLLGHGYVNHTFNLSLVGAQFVTGNRLYLEAGLLSSSGGVGADRLFVDFNDTSSLPLRSLTEPLSGGAIAAIVVVVVVVSAILCISAVVGYRRWKQNQEAGDDDDELN